MPDKKSENRGPGPGREQEGERRSPGGKPSREIEREAMSEGESEEILERVFDVEIYEDVDEESEITQRNPRVGVDDEHGDRE